MPTSIRSSDRIDLEADRDYREVHDRQRLLLERARFLRGMSSWIVLPMIIPVATSLIVASL